LVLLELVPGSSTGLANTIWVGGPDVNSTTGFPILEGKDLKLFVMPNTELYAVSDISAGINMRVFDLQ